MKSPIFSHRNYSRVKQLTGKSGYISALSVGFLLFVGIEATVLAQIVPDSTLPNDSVTLPNGNTIEITGGTTAGSNLFHSFEEFSVFTGNTAWFDNALTIENIITRVTGGSISNIDGLLRANGNANLFLINPQGIVFGENATLDIGGSFLGSTADSLRFADGNEFSAVNPQENPLLTVSIPLGLQYGTNNGDIVVGGSGNQLQFNPDFTVNRASRPTGLQVRLGQTLALVGGNVFVEGGNLTAEAGKIELGGVGSNSLVKLTAKGLDYSEVSNFQDIYLTNAASLEVSGNGGGNVSLWGREVIITDGSAILADNVGDIDGGKLQVNAAELLVVAGTSEELPFISRLSTDVAPRATGSGGDIELNSGTLIVTDGAQVVSSSYGIGNTGNIRIKADELELISGSPILGSSGIFTLVFGSGDGGNIDIEANNIFVLDGAEAAALTFGDGDGGNLLVQANSVEITGTSPDGLSSRFSTNSEGTGDGGNLTIASEYLLVADGGALQSSVFGSGDGGNLSVKATEVELISGAPGVGASGLFANVEPGATGNGGNLSIESKSLLVADGAQAAVTTFGEGNGGTLTIEADNIQLIGTSPNGFPSSLASNVEPGATGSGGKINIATQQLQIADGAGIVAITRSSGLAGDINISADVINLVGVASNFPSAIFSTVEEGASGNGGNININTGSLKVTEGAQIAVSTRGAGSGGELNITSDIIELIGVSEFGASGIFGNAIKDIGNGGNLNITTNSLSILDGATISASNFSSSGNISPGTGKAGNILIETKTLTLDTTSTIPSSVTASTNAGGGGEIDINVAETITLNNNSQISAETLGNGDGGSIAITAKTLNLNSGGQVSTNSDGIGEAGNITITTADKINANQGNITATSTQSGGGNINLNTDFMFLQNNSLVSTSVLDSTGGGGNLTINSDYVIAKDNSDLRANAVFGTGGNINILTEVILLSLDSDVDASSEFGLDGVVEIKNPDSNKKIGVIQLQNKTTDSTKLLTANCILDENNSFIVAGKGGLSDNPSQYLRIPSVWEDFRDLGQSTASASNNEVVVEANQWIVNDKGNVELLSHLPFNQCGK